MTTSNKILNNTTGYLQECFISTLGQNAQDGSLATIDEIRILSTSRYVLDDRQTQTLSGIDRFDLSAAQEGGVVVRIDPHFLEQSDTGQIEFQFAQQGYHRVDLFDGTEGVVLVDGAGTLEIRGAQEPGGSSGVVVHLSETSEFNVIGSRNSETIVGNDEDTIWDLGAGEDIVTGGGGTDTFVFEKGYDSYTIRDFTAGEDVLAIKGFSFFNKEHLVSLASQQGDDVVLQLSENDVIVLENRDVSSLMESKIVYEVNSNYEDSGIRPLNGSMFSFDGNTYLVDVGVGIDLLNAFIADAPAGSTIVLKDGTHRFTDSLKIDRPDISVRGESETGTRLVFDLDPETAVDGIVIGSRSSPEVLTTITIDTTEAQTAIHVEDTSQISAGDFLYIWQENTTAYLQSTGDTEYDAEQAAKSPFRETLVKVVKVEGNKVFLENEVSEDFDAGNATVGKVDLLEGVSLHDLTVTYDLSNYIEASLKNGPNHNDFENVVPEFVSAAGVHVTSTYGFEASGISVINAASHGFWFQNSLSLSAEGLSTDGSYNKGSAGNGYGVQLYETFHSTFSNLELFNNRHAFLFSSWHAENNNTVHVSETNRDINFHGSFDHANTVTVDRLVLEYQPNQNTSDLRGYWTAISLGGKAHVDTDIYGANTINLNYVIGHDADDFLLASDSLYYMAGGGGNDTLHGNNSSNYLLGEEGDDLIYAGNGSDKVSGGEGDDRVIDDHGHDQIYGNEGNDWINSGMGEDYVSGGDGNDKIYSGSGSDTVHGGSGHDLIESSSGHDVVFGNSGDDWINAGSGDDIVDGGTGADTIYGSAGRDELRGGGGDDLISGGYSEDLLDGGEGNDILKGNSGDDTIYGGSGNDKLYGGSASDELFGDDGNDILYGDTGHDTLHGGSGDDKLCGEIGSDFLFGESGDDRLYGATGYDYLDGGQGDDILSGGDDDDILAGGAGDDRLLGGAGSDCFVFTSMAAGEMDRILDFQDSLDHIDLSGTSLGGLDEFGQVTYGDGVKLTFANGSSIVLSNINLSSLDQSDFIF